MREPAPCYPPHGEVIGSIVFRLHGLEVCAELLSTGKHCRTHGVRIDGKIVGMMGADMAWREVSRLMPRMLSIRSL